MQKVFFLICMFFLGMPDASAFDVSLLFNNKEAFTREITKEEILTNLEWSARHPLGSELAATSKALLQKTFDEMEKAESNCELGLMNRIQKNAVEMNLVHNSEELLPLMQYLRLTNLIDDILFRIMKEAALINAEFIQNAHLKAPPRPFNLNTRENAGMNLTKFYSPVKKWPNEIDTCTFDTYWNMISDLKWKKESELQVQMKKLNWMAYKDGHIDLVTYNKMEVLRNRKVFKWPVYFNRYTDIITHAKDKLTKTPEVKTENDFTVEYVSRRDKITQRGNLYRTYTSTQIVLMSQILERTAKRMDARYAAIHWQYTDDPNGEGEIYVLSPMEQYRAAIKMLRKDMAEVMRSETFKNTGIQFEHIVAAAFETGYIKSDELALVLKFEDFWNPKTPKWKAYASFAFSLAGTATLFLPPPWNIVGAIAIVLTQSAVMNEGKTPDPDDNANVII